MDSTQKKLVVLCLALVITMGLKAQIIYEWSYVKDNGNIDRALVVNPEGSYIHVAGTTVRPEGLKLYSRKYRNDGTWQWSRTGNTVLPGPVLFMKRDADLNTFIVCENISTGNYTILKYGRDAIQRWRKNFSERPVGLEIDESGKIYTGGQASGGFFARCYRNSNGNIIFARSESSGREAHAMDIDNSGNIYVGGVDGLAIGHDDIRIVKFGISSYSFIWATNWDGGGGRRDNVDLLTVDVVGNVYVAGEIDAYGSMGANVSMAKFNSAGVFQWQHFITGAGGSSSAHEVSLIIDPIQNPVLVVRKTDWYNVSPVNSTQRILVAKLNRTTGAEIFKEYPNDPTYTDPNIRELPVCASVDIYGNVYIGGFGNNGGFPIDVMRWTITKVDALDGHLKWIEAGNGINNIENQVNDVYVSTEGDVYLAVTETFTTRDFEIVKFSQPGGGLRLANQEMEAESISESKINIYPNPSAEKFTFKHPSPGEPVNINIFDVTGKLVRQFENVSESFDFGEDFTQGIYSVNILFQEENKSVLIIKTNY